MKALLLFILCSTLSFAADVAGKWKGTAETPNGTMERTFDFKVDGTKLTGTTTHQMFGESTITDGKVEGDNVSFTILIKFDGNEMKVNYKGKVTGDQMKITAETEQGSFEYNAKRVS